MNCLATITADPIADGPSVAAGLRDTAAVCSAEQVALAARLLIAAHVIEALHARCITQPDLLDALSDMTKRFHHCLVHGGTAPAYADAAVASARAAIAKASKP